MSLTPGQELAHYEIREAIGAGGMGEVFSAHDTKLGRDVAIKVLPAEFSQDTERLERFQREARLLAQLNHTNIATLHGLEESEGQKFLVMELVGGETLAERLARGPIPVDEAIPLFIAIAEGLEAAHEKSVIHRDLKPANIKITADGTPKILDFGLAKAFQDEPEGLPSSSLSPTLTKGTAIGTIMGTAAYMSPEQARGKPVDRRADIWAFGVVLYEALTGRRLFEGETVSDTLASVLRADVRWDALPSETPGSVRRLLRRCLNRDPKARLQHMGDARLELDAREDAAPTSAAGRPPGLAYLAAAALSGMAVAAVLAAGFWPAPPRPQVVEFDIAPPDDFSLIGAPAVAPDGSTIAFVAAHDGINQIYLRPIDGVGADPLDDTEGAQAPPFWSPDSSDLAFFAEGALKRISVDRRGRSQIVCRLPDANSAASGTWGSKDVIVLESGYELYGVAAAGGKPDLLIAQQEGLRRMRSPTFLPDGEHYLFYGVATRDEEVDRNIFVSSLDGAAPKRLIEMFRVLRGGIRYAAGYLLTVDANGSLIAYPFDSKNLEIVDDPILVVSDYVGFGWNVSNDVLAFRNTSGTSTGRLELTDRRGRLLQQLGELGDFWSPRFSPDGSRVAAEIHLDSGAGDVHVFDLDSGRRERITFAPDLHNSSIVWAPDGSEIAFHRSAPFGAVVLAKPASGGGDVREIADFGVTAGPTDWSADGEHLLINESSDDLGWNIWSVAMPASGKPEPYAVSEANEMQGAFSPDGNWVAYASDESGRFEIYLRPFPAEGDTRWQLTSDGGEAPRWRGDGGELFYLAPGGRFLSLEVSLATRPPRWTSPVELFQRAVQQGTGPIRDLPPYDVTADGETFLLNASSGQYFPIRVIVNWQGLVTESSTDR